MKRSIESQMKEYDIVLHLIRRHSYNLQKLTTSISQATSIYDLNNLLEKEMPKGEICGKIYFDTQFPKNIKEVNIIRKEVFQLPELVT